MMNIDDIYEKNLTNDEHLKEYISLLSPNNICNFSDWKVQNNGEHLRDGNWGDYESSQYKCACGHKIKYQYSIKNIINNAVIPTEENYMIAIGSVCIEKFLNREEYDKILVQQNKIIARKNEIEDKLNRKYKFCMLCDCRTKKTNIEKHLVMCKNCDKKKLDRNEIRRLSKLRMEYNCLN